MNMGATMDISGPGMICLGGLLRLIGGFSSLIPKEKLSAAVARNLLINHSEGP